MDTENRKLWRFWLDQGGTFTDCIGVSPAGETRLAKVLSSPLAPLKCIRDILGLKDSDPIPPCDIRLGTTLATNALLERRGSPHALLISEGFADALAIGTQQRPDLFALNIVKPQALYAESVEARGRLGPDGSEAQPLDVDKLCTDLSALRARGFENLAIVLLHGYAFPAHEKAAAECARRLGFKRISCSHEVNPEIGFTARGDTTTVDAYLTPLLAAYLETLASHLPGSSLRLMQSGGGLCDPDRFRGHNAILSGPAGGVVACARLAQHAGYPRAIGFDMGGTSTDVSRWDGRGFGKVYEWNVSGLRVRSPSLDIHTVAAGGGSVCRIQSGRLTVGPESAGSDPGPLCYGGYGRRAGGDRGREAGPAREDDAGSKGNLNVTGNLYVTVTDVNLFLGRLVQDNFPFPLRAEPVRARMQAMAASLRAEGQDISAEDLARGFLEIVNRQMAQAIKDISLARGHDVSDHALICFGGAGGQHACAVARLLGIRRILLHPYAGVLSALGMGLAETRWEGSAPVARLTLGPVSLTPENVSGLEPRFAELEAQGDGSLRAQGYRGVTVRFRRGLDLRYVGTEYAMSVAEEGIDWREAFERKHREWFGYVRSGRAVEILQMRVEAVGEESVSEAALNGIAAENASGSRAPERTSGSYAPGEFPAAAPRPWKTAPMLLASGRRDAPVFRREELGPGDRVQGPALILDKVATLVVEEGFFATLDAEGSLLLEPLLPQPRLTGPESFADSAAQNRAAQPRRDAAPPAVMLELFNHAFMAVAERMGKVLQRTALSTNIKERLDFSCAVFDAHGNLIANAPHIPVHLGAMGESVRHVLKAWPHPKPGDVFATNNPYRGGSHLPDITVVTPVFAAEGNPQVTPSGARPGAFAVPVFFTANRAHHADVGGATPGSMPSFSSRLEEEGVLLDAVKLVDAGELRSEACLELFRSGAHPARNPADNLADLEAQAAANREGERMLLELVAEHGLEAVLLQMDRLRANAARQVREALAKLPPGSHAFSDALDDGTPIRVRIDLERDGAVIDFTGSGPESGGNLNAPPAVVRSAVMYALRCLVNERIPLNEGCLDPVRIVLPEKSILNPSPGRAVVGGNVETSQRVVDCLLGALGLAAASQGTMNNVTFGDGAFGYYETLAGGAGAGAGFPGASAVHTHMTNTRITDPEVLETRYPVRLERFAIRAGSGGAGRWNGGDGLVREYRFLKPVQVSLLTQRRVLAPFGLEGGGSGSKGVNLRVTPDGKAEVLPGATSYAAESGERLVVETPGGGGFGPA